MSIYAIVRIQLSFVQFSLLCYEFCILSKAECKSIYYHLKRDHESSSIQKLARNKWICQETCDFFYEEDIFSCCKRKVTYASDSTIGGKARLASVQWVSHFSFTKILVVFWGHQCQKFSRESICKILLTGFKHIDLDHKLTSLSTIL